MLFCRATVSLAWIMDGHYHPPKLLKWFEDRVDSGAMNWKQYILGLLIFNTSSTFSATWSYRHSLGCR